MSRRGKLHEGLTSFLGETALERIRGATVGIAGAGGLGSNCAMLLARSGFVNLVIADFDRVEKTNLNRQFFFAHQIGMAKTDALEMNILAIEPSITIAKHQLRVTKENAATLFSHCDAVVEAFDNPQSKAMLAEEIARLGIFLVCASGIAGHGSCDSIRVKRISDSFYIVGDSERAVCPEDPPLAPRVTIAAAKQADLVLHYILTRRDISRT